MQEGGGSFTPCEWRLQVKKSSLQSVLARIEGALKVVEEGSSMEIKVGN